MDAYLDNILKFNEQLNSSGFICGNLSMLARKKPDAIVLMGMGGSALASEIVVSVRKEIGLKLPIFIWKNYDLPDLSAFNFKNPLHVCVSFSGNTEETVSSLKLLIKSKAEVAVIATGGELVQIAEDKKLPLVKFDALQLTPRQATGRMFYGLITLFEAAKVIPKKSLDFSHLKPTAFKAEGKRLAEKLMGNLVVIYTDEANRDLGYFWKIRLNETAKTQAFTHVVPEMNHNEIVSFEKPTAPTLALFVHDKTEGRMAKRFKINSTLLKKHGAKVLEVSLKGKSRLEQTWNMLMLADWAAYYLAQLKKVEPGPVKIVEGLKNLMRG